MASKDLAISRLLHWRRSFPGRGEDGSIYRPLNHKKQEFRLLLLFPGSGDDPIHAELRPTHSRLLRRPRYETISYCWGDPDRLAKVHLNKKTISVPASSAAALRCVRLPDRNRAVWIDALCINQSDLDELAQQVAMMSDIYSKSNGNLIYLGEADSRTRRAVNSIEKLISDIKKRTDNFRSLEGTPFKRPRVGFSSYKDVRIDIDEKYLLEFYSNGWFRRVWTFQEAALAPSNTCLIDHSRLNLIDIVRAAEWINYHDGSFSLHLGQHQGIRCAYALFELVDKAFGHYTNHRPTLEDLFLDSRDLLATDPRDHVYGLLGLWNLYRRQGASQLPAMLAPDYRKPTAKVFRDATRAALEECGSLDAWYLISHLDEAAIYSATSPSWALDLERSWDSSVDPTDISRDERENFNANDKLWITRPTSDPMDLDLAIMYGVRLDQVIYVASVTTSESFHGLENTKSWFANVITTLRKYDEEAMIEDLTPVLLANHRFADEDMRAITDLLHILKEENRLPTWITDITPSTSDREKKVAGLWSEILNTCTDRRIFVTENGYMGVGPKLTQVGDHVVVLHGGKMPFVLRPCNIEYRLLGNCYVECVMDGEAMRRHKDSGNPDTEFRIR